MSRIVSALMSARSSSSAGHRIRPRTHEEEGPLSIAYDELEGVVERHDLTAEGARVAPGLASPPQHLNIIALAGRAQPRDGPAGAQAVEGVAPVRPHHLDAAAPGRPAVGVDPTAHLVPAVRPGAP